jgi:hypothetical protein
MVGYLIIRYGVVNSSVKVDDIMGAGIMLIMRASGFKVPPGIYGSLAAYSHPMQNDPFYRPQGPPRAGILIYRQWILNDFHSFLLIPF